MSQALAANNNHRWTRQQYDRMIETGIFNINDKVELLDGYITDMSPQTSLHAAVVSLVEEAVRASFPKEFYIRTQLPLALDEFSEPEPDVAVVTGNARDYLQQHPDSAVLVVEVSVSTLDYDQNLKKTIYARNRIEDYWIVNLQTACLEVYRQPSGDDYRSQQMFKSTDRIQPLVAAGSAILVADLLP